MIRKEIDIINKLGLHARASAKFVTCASRYSSEIQLARKDQQVNGKSIMGIMMLAAGQGARLTLIVNGADEANAVEALENLVKNRFEEGE